MPAVRTTTPAPATTANPCQAPNSNGSCPGTPTPETSAPGHNRPRHHRNPANPAPTRPPGVATRPRRPSACPHRTSEYVRDRWAILIFSGIDTPKWAAEPLLGMAQYAAIVAASVPTSLFSALQLLI